MKSELSDQVVSSKEQIRAIKETMPYAFPEWQRLQQAKKALAEAKLEHGRAEAAWWQLGQ